MGYKKITFKSVPDAVSEAECKIESSVSAIEINDIFENEEKILKKKRSFPIDPCAAFVCACALAGLIFTFIPIPDKLSGMIEGLIMQISEGSDEAVLEEPLRITGSVFADIPARTENICESELPTVTEKIADLSTKNVPELSNETQYTINFDALFESSYPIQDLCINTWNGDDSVQVFSQSSPEVLIIHTHGTEGYSDSANTNYRTKNTDKNVVAAGRFLAKELEANGISVIHSEEMFDKDSYIRSYSNSYAAVSEYLRKNPSIKYVIDLHRDAVSDANGKYLRLICKNEEAEYAQLMLVVGTDEAGAKHPNWKENLRTAAEIQKNMCEASNGIMRPLNLRRASFNQQLCNGYFILEAGNCANNISEVYNSLEVFAKSFAKTAAG